MVDFLVIGGGVSGVVAAIEYKRNNPSKKVIILEKSDSLLKKLSATGNGKGNFTNNYLSSNSFDNKEFYSSILNDYSYKDILSFMDSINLSYTMDEEGRYYPLSLSAKTITNLLIKEIDRLKIEVIYNVHISNIKFNDYYIINTNINEYNSKKIYVSVGGINYPTLGSDGSLNKVLIDLGIKFTKLVPSNTYILVKEKELTKKLSGLRVKAKLSLYNRDLIVDESGELLFKDNALSGIVSFDISNYIANLYKNNFNENITVYVDFLPTIETKEYLKIINKNNSLDLLEGMFNEKLFTYLVKPNKNNLSILKKYPFNVVGLGGLENAQVTCGGVDTSFINNNLEHIIYKNMYFGGDIIDISAICGGYNLSFAILCGIKVGRENG